MLKIDTRPAVLQALVDGSVDEQMGRWVEAREELRRR